MEGSNSIEKVNSSVVPPSINLQKTSSEVKNSNPINISPIYSQPIVAKAQASNGGNYWGMDLEDMNISTESGSGYSRAVYTTTVANGELSWVDGTYAFSRTYILNLESGIITNSVSGGTSEPGTITPDQKDIYYTYILRMIDCVKQQQGIETDTAKKDKLQTVINYLDGIRIEMEKINYWGGYLEDMDVTTETGTGYGKAGQETKVANGELSSTIGTYAYGRSYTLNLGSGIITNSVTGGTSEPGTITPDQKDLYHTYIIRMIDCVQQQQGDEPDPAKKAEIQSALDYLAMINNRVASGDFPIIQPPIIQPPIIQPPLPSTYEASNYPNPFKPLENAVQIRCKLPQDSMVTIRIYDIAGKLVRTLGEEAGAGIHNIPWDGKNNSQEMVASGVYIAVITFKGADGTVEKKTIRIAAIK